jgi:hypothetical protein
MHRAAELETPILDTVHGGKREDTKPKAVLSCWTVWYWISTATGTARAFHCRDRHIFVRLYTQYVKPHLEFARPARSPWLEADKEKLEKI